MTTRKERCAVPKKRKLRAPRITVRALHVEQHQTQMEVRDMRADLQTVHRDIHIGLAFMSSIKEKLDQAEALQKKTAGEIDSQNQKLTDLQTSNQDLVKQVQDLKDAAANANDPELEAKADAVLAAAQANDEKIADLVSNPPGGETPTDPAPVDPAPVDPAPVDTVPTEPVDPNAPVDQPPATPDAGTPPADESK